MQIGQSRRRVPTEIALAFVIVDVRGGRTTIRLMQDLHPRSKTSLHLRILETLPLHLNRKKPSEGTQQVSGKRVDSGRRRRGNVRVIVHRLMSRTAMRVVAWMRSLRIGE